MQVETQQAEPQVTNFMDGMECPNCQAVLPQGMLFCRMCGTRLIEGSITEATTMNLRANAASGALPAAHWQAKRRRGPHWIVWVVLGIVVASFAGGALFRPAGKSMFRPSVTSNATQSRMGVDDITSIENNGGAMIESVTPPDSPADKAGIIGGDIITSFDTRPVKDEDDLRSAIRATPVGKTVEVIYIRDGETKKTSLTTVNEDEIDRLNDKFREQEKGQLGVDDLERVPVPDTNIYGVRIGQISKNRAAYFADLKEGDIIIEFNGTPIRTSDELTRRIYRTAPLSPVKVLVVRDGQKIEFGLKMGVR